MHNTLTDIRSEFKRKLDAEEFVIDKSGVKMIELVGTTFIADEPSIFGKPDSDYIAREIDWYVSKSLNVNDIPGGAPTIWKQVATPEGLINSNYGYLIFDEQKHYQFAMAIRALIQHRESRRSIMIYTRPTIQTEYNLGGMSDFICTNTVQLLIRNNKLDMIVNMRSNDAVFGYKNDCAWQRYIQDFATSLYNDQKPDAEALISPGKIYWQTGSLHVYERHFKFVK